MENMLEYAKIQKPYNAHKNRRVFFVFFFFSKVYQVIFSTPKQGPVVQSVVSLTSSLRVISLTVLADSIYNILIFFAEKM